MLRNRVQLLDCLKASHPVVEGCQFGKTMILYKAEPHRLLEQLRYVAGGGLHSLLLAGLLT